MKDALTVYIGIEDNAFGKNRKAACAYAFSDDQYIFTIGSSFRTLAYWIKSRMHEKGISGRLELTGSEVPQGLRDKTGDMPLGFYRPANEDEIKILHQDIELSIEKLNPWRDDRIGL